MTEQEFQAYCSSLCSEVDPELWEAFCKFTGRENQPSDVWTVGDVVEWFAQEVINQIDLVKKFICPNSSGSIH
jgi:hypothetical protein